MFGSVLRSHTKLPALIVESFGMEKHGKVVAIDEVANHANADRSVSIGGTGH